MRNKGFIATSVLYSFFIVFVTLFISLITTYLHNRILLAKIHEEAWNSLWGINNTKISDLQVGDYVRFATPKKDPVLNENARWIVAYIEENEDNLTYYFLSDTTAQKPVVTFQTSYDLIPKLHPMSIQIYDELKMTTMYRDSFCTPNFDVYIVPSSLLTKIKYQNISEDIRNNIFNVKDNYLVYIDDNLGTYQNNQYYEIKTYNFSPTNQPISSYCGGNFDGTNVNYDSSNTFGYIHLTNDSLTLNKYVDYCSYASPIPYSHSASELIVESDVNQVDGDIMSSVYSSSYSYRLVAEITVNKNTNDNYLAGGKGLYINPYIYTDGKANGEAK